jgi:NADPH:quinone reductase-like Zn-dependent oxidoreductase
MKAIVRAKYGRPSEALRLEEQAMPVPKDDEALVRVHASSVNPMDWYLTRGKPFMVRLVGAGVLRPRSTLAGADVAGVVTAVGKSVSELRPGDEVFGIGTGAFAEYMTVPESTLVTKPASLSFEEAAGVPLAGLTALQALRAKGKVQPGQKVLVHGASGGVGTFAVQIGKALGADVTAVCSTSKVDQIRSLGADRVIDYTKEDFSQGERQYDVVLVVNGSRPVGDYRRVLNSGGACIFIGGSIGQIVRLAMFGRFYSGSSKGRVSSFMMQPNKPDLLFLKGLIEGGRVNPIMDRNFPLTSVADALEYLHAGHARGKISITVP